GKDFKRSMYSTIHEYGHALYELQIDERLSGTLLATGVSGGMHESQSRFWENIIGRSRVFAEAIYPIIKKHLKFVEKYTPEELYYYFNTVKPSLIRVDADEVTYNLHILLRYKLEKAMITGDVKIGELPEVWNSEIERLIGVRPKSDSEGVLQDIHWSSGLGSFCNYTIGNIIAAQIRKHMMKKIKIDEEIMKLNFKPIREYLKEKVHIWGSTYEPKELLKRSFNEEMNPIYLLEYLEEKYLKV
ncbi:MAG: carboxypeptidase M32, partial [Candidatus Methanomethylicia archaeon]